MNINRSNPERWDEDIKKSVDHYNEWFSSTVPPLYHRAKTAVFPKVREAMDAFNSILDYEDNHLVEAPGSLKLLRQMTCPPLAADRLAGLAGVPSSVIDGIEECTIRPKSLEKYSPLLMEVIREYLDFELLAWVGAECEDEQTAKFVAASVVTDRICKAETDAVVRNLQERRQFDVIAKWLNGRGYKLVDKKTYQEILPGEYAEHVNVPARSGSGTVNVSCDIVVQPLSAKEGSMPILIEEKSAGDFANVNKRRKEESDKLHRLAATYRDVNYILFLGGYFNRVYLEYEANEGLDWVWEHRVFDMEKLGL